MKLPEGFKLGINLKLMLLAVGMIIMAETQATPSIGQTGLAQRKAPQYSVPPSNHTQQYSRYGYSTYKGYADPYGTPLPQQSYPIRPPVNQRPHYPHYGHPPARPVYPQQNGVTIIYNHQFPTQTEYRTESHGFVNGQGTIESSSYMLISDWQRYNLPAPQVGMHWIYQDGRYLQVPNNR